MSARKQKREQLALAKMSADLQSTRDVFVNRSPSSVGVTLHIVSAATEENAKRDADEDAAVTLDALLELPHDTRRALYNLITGEFCESFNAAPRSEPKYSPPITPSARRRR